MKKKFEKVISIIFCAVIMIVPMTTIVKMTFQDTKKIESETGSYLEENESITEIHKHEQMLAEQTKKEEEEQKKQELESEPVEDENKPNTEDIKEPQATKKPTVTKVPQATQKPSFMEQIKDVTEDVKDNLAMKEEVNGATSEITSAITDESYIKSNQVILGKDRWLFYKNQEDGQPLSDYQGTNHFSETRLKKIRDNLVKQRDAMKAQGVRFVIMPIPNKEIIYAELMPDTVYRKTETTRLDQLIDYLRKNSDLEIIYPKDDMLKKKNATQLYYKTDTHWNIPGAFVGTQNLLKGLYGTYSDVDSVEFKVEKNNFSGDLAKLCKMTDKFKDDIKYSLPASQINNEQKVQESLVVIGDSFSNNLVSVAKNYWSKVTNIGVWSFKKEHLNKYKPDVVVWECVERYIDRYDWIDLMK